MCLFHQSGLFRYFYVIFLSMSAAFHSSLFLLVTLLSKSTFKLSTLCIFEMQKKFSQYCLNTGSCYIVVYLFDFRISFELLWWCFFCLFVLFCFFQRDLAKLLFQMGAVKSALDIFQQIHAWEDVVYCYQSLGWHAKVRSMLQSGLAQDEGTMICPQPIRLVCLCEWLVE